MYGNYYNPFGFQSFRPRASMFGGINKGINGKFFGNLFHKFNLSSFLSGTSKTLNVINQAIPIYYQIKPMFNNAKTMFKIVSAVKNEDNNSNIKTESDVDKKSFNNSHQHIYEKNYDNPKFFI